MLETMVISALQRGGIVPPEFTFSSRPIGFFFQSGALVEIVNANGTTTSYRTAFSHFLAERLT